MSMYLQDKGLHYPYGMPMPGEDVLWRCEPKQYSYVIDADREEYGVTTPRLEMTWHHVSKRTPFGAWVGSRWINLQAAKKWATETPEEALEQLRHRNKSLVRILTNRLRTAEFVQGLIKQAATLAETATFK